MCDEIKCEEKHSRRRSPRRLRVFTVYQRAERDVTQAEKLLHFIPKVHHSSRIRILRILEIS